MDQLTAQGIFREQLKKFVDLNEAEWIVFAQHLDFSSLKKKKYFIQPGMVCQHIGFIVKGSVRYYHVKDGEEITGYFSFENEFVSSYKSYLTQQPGISYIQALEDTELITISRGGGRRGRAGPGRGD